MVVIFKIKATGMSNRLILIWPMHIKLDIRTKVMQTIYFYVHINMYIFTSFDRITLGRSQKISLCNGQIITFMILHMNGMIIIRGTQWTFFEKWSKKTRNNELTQNDLFCSFYQPAEVSTIDILLNISIGCSCYNVRNLHSIK